MSRSGGSATHLAREDSRLTFAGLDHAALREAGVLVEPFGDTYAVKAVLPDTPASRLGLRPGDLLTQAVGRDESSLGQARQRIAPGEAIAVSRRGENEVRVNIELPAGGVDQPKAPPHSDHEPSPPAPGSASTPPERRETAP